MSCGKCIFYTCCECSLTASKGLVDAAHFCYLMAQVGFGVFTKKSTKMVLISSNHRCEQNIQLIKDMYMLENKLAKILKLSNAMLM